MLKRSRRHRTLSVEAEIKQRAAQIQRDQMSEAMKAAALMIVGRKLDEIRGILGAVGIDTGRPAPVVAAIGSGGSSSGGTSNAVIHACSYCGRESVYRTKPHRFNRQGTWLCQAHYPLRRQHEAGGGTPIVEEVTPETSEPVVNGGPPLPPDKPDTGGDVGVADAFAALGIQTNAQ